MEIKLKFLSLGVFIGLLIASFIMEFSRIPNELKIEREKAIKAKVGEYYLDENSEKQFRYKVLELNK